MNSPSGLAKIAQQELKISDMDALGATSDCQRLEWVPASNRLRPFVSGSVYRLSLDAGGVTLELPERRPSIQLMLADPYWLRGSGARDGWWQVPRLGLWGPQTAWRYGYARRNVEVLALALTADGLRTLTGGQPMAAFANTVVDLNQVAPGLAAGLEAEGVLSTSNSQPAREWLSRIETLLLRVFETAPQKPVRPVGERQQRRRMAQTGAGDKLWRRLDRLDRLLSEIHPNAWERRDDDGVCDPWSDQAHMIRECKALTGLTPGAYFKAKQRDGDRLIRTVRVYDVPGPDGHLVV